MDFLDLSFELDRKEAPVVVNMCMSYVAIVFWVELLLGLSILAGVCA